MECFDFNMFNDCYIGENYVFVWDNEKEEADSCEAYFMKWNGSDHEIFRKACGENEVEALSNLKNALDKAEIEFMNLIQEGKKHTSDLISSYVYV